MRTAGSILFTIITVVLLPVVLVGWTLRTTVLEDSFYLSVMEESGFWEQVTDVVLVEFLTPMLVNGEGFLPPEILEEKLEALIAGTFSPVYLNAKSAEIFEELERWMESEDSFTNLDIKINLAEIKTVLPGKFREIYTEVYNEMPECTTAQVLEFATAEDKQLPTCRLPDAVLGFDTSGVSEEIMDEIMGEIDNQLRTIPDEISTRAYFAGEIPGVQPDPDQLAEWDRTLTQIRDNINIFKRALTVSTLLLILAVLGGGALHIPAWRRVLAWISLPVLLETSLVFLVALGAWISAPAIINAIMQQIGAANGEFAPGIERISLAVGESAFTLLFLRLMLISGILAIVSGAVYGARFFLKHSEDPTTKKPSK